MTLLETEPYQTFLLTLPSQNTTDAYFSRLNEFQGFLSSQGLTVYTAQPDHMLQYFAQAKRKLKPSTLCLTISALNSFYRSLVKRRLIPANPAEILEGMAKKPRRDPRPLDTDDRKKLIDALRFDDPEDLRQSLVVLLGMHAGLRVSEIRSLRTDAFDFSGGKFSPFGTVTVVGKGDKERMVPMSEQLKKCVLRYNEITTRQKDFFGKGGPRPLFPSKVRRLDFVCLDHLEKLLQRVAKRAGIRHGATIGIHVLRHTFGTILGETGASAYEIRDLMGHSSIQTSEGYVKIGKRQVFKAHIKAFNHA